MAYNTKWDPYKAEECRKKAEEKSLGPGMLWGNGFLYRLEDVSYAYCRDPDGDEWGSYVQVELIAFPVSKWTKCGARIQARYGYGKDKFVNLEANKKYACKTVDEAVKSFVARKDKQIRIYQVRIDRAVEARSMALGKLEGMPQN